VLRLQAALPVCMVVALLAASCAPVLAQKSSTKPSNDDCLTCHGDSSLTREVNGKSVNLYVAPDKFNDSMHGSMFSCLDCHTDVKSSPHDIAPAKISCTQCHAEEQSAYDRSLHARRNHDHGGNGATCADCHGSPHELLAATDAKSKVNHANIPTTCGGCHGQKFVMQTTGLTTQPFLSYQESVHGRAIRAGIMKAAVCTDCHGTHEILSASDPKSPIFKFNVPQTCGKCHEQVEKQFAASIHGQAVARGNSQAPVCTDCHGIHAIKSPHDANSPVSVLSLAQATCARCHESVRLSEEFGIESRKATTYLASYHGLASRLGSHVVANCASCHGSHGILPSSDPRSSVNHANLLQTCGQCHPGVTERFVSGKIHIDYGFSQDKGSVAVRWIRRFYLAVIGVVIGGMLLHNFILWRWSALQSRRGRQQVQRMSGNQRWQHLVLLSSFVILVVTGFALKYPGSGYASLLGMSEGVRRITHRIAGAVLIAAGIYHICYAVFWREGRRMVRDFLPTKQDAISFWANVRYHLGAEIGAAQFGRFDYTEKTEYWAVVWGTVIMGVTGVMLWAKVYFGNLFPRWWLDVATAIHFYEAVLATLAILVWHFYSVFFSEHSYPMNWTWWDGKTDLKRYREAHCLDADMESANSPQPTEDTREAGRKTDESQ